MINSKNTDISCQLKALSAQDFLNIGVNHIVYIRPDYTGGVVAYNIYAADGTQLASQNSWETAAALARQNSLEPVMIH